jgi:hypothetical protein
MDIASVWEKWRDLKDPRLFAVTKNKEYYFWMFDDLFQKVSKINNAGLCETQKKAVFSALSEGSARIKHADTNEVFYVKDSINIL